MPPQESARGPHVLRQINTAAVLRALRDHSPARLADLVRATGLSRPAVTRAAADLREAGLISDVDELAQSAVGRPAQWVRFRAEVGHVVGVDVGSLRVLAMVSDLAGRVVASRQVPVPVQAQAPGPGPGQGKGERGRGGEPATGTEMLRSIREAVSNALAAAGLGAEDVWAITVGAPGIVDDRSGEVLLAPSIPGWAHLPVLADLRTRFSCPVLMENDVNLAVLAECWRGAATGSDNLIFVHWGVRIGAGILIDGKPYRGAHAAAGEIGFADVFSAADPREADLTLVDAAQLGPFERMVGAQAILELADAEVGRSGARSGSGGLQDPTSQDAVVALFDAAAAGDAVALGVVDRMAARFARGLAVLLLVLDPQEVIIGGGVSRAGDTLLDAIERHLRPRTLTWPRLALSALGGDAVALGAVRRGLDHIEDRLLAHRVS